MFPGTGSAEPVFTPAVTLSEEYNDNIFLQPSGEVSDYITRLLPSARIQYKAPFWDWDAAYSYDYRHYARNVEVDNSTQEALITNQTRLIREFLFLDAKDVYDRVSLNTARDFTQESLFVNQTDQNILQLNPYVVFHPGPSMTLSTGYTYRNIWYKDIQTVTVGNPISKVDQIAAMEAKDEASPRLTLSMRLKQTSDANRVDDYRESDLALGPRYEYAEGSFLWFFLGGTRIAFDKSGTGRQFTWDAGITHKLSTYSLTIATALNYIDDPLLLLRREDRYMATLKSEAQRISLPASTLKSEAERAPLPASTGFFDQRSAEAKAFEEERTPWSVSAGFLEYRNVVTQALEQRTYQTRVSFAHSITRRWKGAYDLTIDRYEDKQVDTVTVLYVTEVRFDYLAAEKLTLSIDYRYSNSYSPDFYLENYDNNRFIVEAKYVF